jgi:hypothetical protein
MRHAFSIFRREKWWSSYWVKHSRVLFKLKFFVSNFPANFKSTSKNLERQWDDPGSPNKGHFTVQNFTELFTFKNIYTKIKSKLLKQFKTFHSQNWQRTSQESSGLWRKVNYGFAFSGLGMWISSLQFNLPFQYSYTLLRSENPLYIGDVYNGCLVSFISSNCNFRQWFRWNIAVCSYKFFPTRRSRGWWCWVWVLLPPGNVEHAVRVISPYVLPVPYTHHQHTERSTKYLCHKLASR